MEAYTGFAKLYDTFMLDTPYEEWAGFIQELLCSEGISEGIVLDLGCGTGKLTECLAGMGYDMIGADSSAQMLDVAIERRARMGLDILYLLQDMREFELYGTVRAVVSSCDCINYVMDEKELEDVFRLVNNYLDPSGIFIFDFNTQFKYETILGDNTIAENREEGSFIWENYYYEEEQVNEYKLTLFNKEETGLYRKYEELHYQKAYTLDVIRKLLIQAGLEFVGAYDDYTYQAVKETSERVCVIAREKGKVKTNE